MRRLDEIRRGIVTAFDHERGLGTLQDAGTGAELPFHCTAIADGTRAVQLGAPVAFVVARGHLGRQEARAVAKLLPAARGGDIR